MSEDQAINILIITGVFVGFISNYLVHNIINGVKSIKSTMQINKKFWEAKKEVKEMKSKGENHEWIKIKTMQGEKLVCKKTGWCPEIGGFFPKKIIEQYLLNEKIRKETEKKYEKFKDSRIKEVSDRYDLDEVLIRGIMEKAFEIRKEFYVKNIEDTLNEVKSELRNEQRN